MYSRALCEEHGEEFLRMHLASRSRAHQASLAYVVPCHETMSERRAMIGRVAVARRPSPCSPTHRSDHRVRYTDTEITMRSYFICRSLYSAPFSC